MVRFDMSFSPENILPMAMHEEYLANLNHKIERLASVMDDFDDILDEYDGDAERIIEDYYYKYFID